MNVAEWGKEPTESLADGPGAPALLTLAPCGDATASDEVVLTEVAQDHPHGTLTLILGVPLGHNRYPSRKRKRHQTRYGSGSNVVELNQRAGSRSVSAVPWAAVDSPPVAMHA
jgi:hypothetical protein